MSIEGKAKEAASFVKEEMNEDGDTPEARKKAQEGRDLLNESRVEDGKAPKTTEPHRRQGISLYLASGRAPHGAASLYLTKWIRSSGHHPAHPHSRPFPELLPTDAAR